MVNYKLAVQYHFVSLITSMPLLEYWILSGNCWLVMWNLVPLEFGNIWWRWESCHFTVQSSILLIVKHKLQLSDGGIAQGALCQNHIFCHSVLLQSWWNHLSVLFLAFKLPLEMLVVLFVYGQWIRGNIVLFHILSNFLLI